MRKHFSCNRLGRYAVSFVTIFALLLTMIPLSLFEATAYETENFQANSLFADSSFETKNYGRGKFSLDTKTAHTGSKSIKLATDGEKAVYSYLKSATQIDATKSYQVGVWIKASQSPLSGTAFFWCNYGKGQVEWGNTSITDQWTYYSYRISGLVDTNKMNLNMGFGVSADFDGITIWFDDFTLIEITEPNPDELVTDASLEGGIYGDQNFTLDGNVCNAHTGVNSLKVIANGTDMSYGYLSADVTADRAYEVGMWVRADKDIADKPIHFVGYYYDTSGIRNDLEPFGNFSVSKEWVFCTYKLKNLSSADKLYIGVGVTHDADEITIWFDDFKVSETEDSGDNLFPDGSFETETYGNADYTHDSDDSHTGSKSLKVQATGSWKEYSYFKEASISASKTYVLSVYAKASEKTTSDTVFFKGRFSGVNSTWVDLGNTAYNALTTEWKKYICILEMPKFNLNDQTVNFAVSLGITEYVKDVTVWFDDISIVEVPDIEHIDTGLYPGGDFEGATDAYKSGEWDKDTETFYGGFASLKATGGTDQSFYCKNATLTDDYNADYKLTLYIKTENCPGKRDVSVNIFELNDKGEATRGDWYKGKTGDYKLIATGGTHDWTKFTYTFRGGFAEDTSALQVYLRMDSTGSAWFDNVTLKKIENVEPKGPMICEPKSGAVNNFARISLSYGEADVAIMYTVDETDPKTSDSVQIFNETAGIIITGDTVITAYAQPEGYPASQNYTFKFFAPEMVANGGFDEGLWVSSGDGWQLEENGTNKFASCKSSSYSTITSSITAIDSQYDYTLRFKAKSESLADLSSGCYVTLHNSQKGSVGDKIYKFDKKLITIDEGTSDWKEYSVILSDIEEGFDGLSITAFQNAIGGKVSFDDFDIDVVQATSEAFEILGYTQNIGNIYFGDPDKHEIEFFLSINNLMSRSFENTVIVSEVEDMATGDIIATESFSLDFIEPKETIERKLNMKSVLYYGTFKIKVHIKNDLIDLNNEFKVARYKVADSQNDMVGVNTHIATFFDGGKKENIGIQALDLIKKAGFAYVSEDFQWSMVETEKGVIKIPECYYGFVKACKDRNLKIQMNLSAVNPLYAGGNRPVTDEDISACAKAYAALAKEFKGQITSWEVCGEIDYSYSVEFGSKFETEGRTPEDYCRLLKAVYQAIKKEDPGTLVTYGAVLQYGSTAQRWLERLLAAGGGQYSDSIAIHPYAYNYGTPYGVIDLWYKKIQELSVKYNVKRPVIRVSEIGWTTCPGDKDGIGCTEIEQAAWSMQAYLISKMNDNVEFLSFYDISNDNIVPDDKESNFGLLGISDQTKDVNGVAYLAKPAFGIFSTISDELTGIKFIEEIKIDSGIVGMKFKKADGREVIAIWNYQGDSRYIRLDSRGLAGNAEWFDSFGNKFGINTANNSFGLTLSGAPVFISADVINALRISNDVDNTDNQSGAIIHQNGSGINNGFHADYETNDSEEIEDMDENPSQVVKKIIKKRKKNDTALSMGQIIGISVGGVAGIAAVCGLSIFLIKRRKKKKSIGNN